MQVYIIKILTASNDPQCIAQHPRQNVLVKSRKSYHQRKSIPQKKTYPQATATGSRFCSIAATWATRFSIYTRYSNGCSIWTSETSQSPLPTLPTLQFNKRQFQPLFNSFYNFVFECQKYNITYKNWLIKVHIQKCYFQIPLFTI